MFEGINTVPAHQIALPQDRQICESPDLERIRRLPWMPWMDDPNLPILVQALTAHLRTPNGTETLRPAQAAALKALHDYGGLFAPIPVGGGKTHISLLAAAVVEAERPLLLIPKNMERKTRSDAYKLAQHWRIPPIKIVGYEKLSRDYDGEIFDDYKPDLILADEGDALANTKSSRTQAVRDYIRRERRLGRIIRFGILSGSFTANSVREYWHLLRWSLGDLLCPLPTQMDEVIRWGAALNYLKDEEQGRLAPGALLTLGPYDPDAPPLVQGRQAYQARLNATPGVVSVIGLVGKPKRKRADGTDEDIPITIKGVELEAPEVIRQAVSELRTYRQTPDGHPFDDDISVWRHARELQCGFYYVWDPRPPDEWLIARREWSQWCYAALKHSRSLRSKGHLIREIENGAIDDGMLLANWRAVKDTFRPNTVARWIDTSTLQRAAEWLARNPRGICWVEHTCFGYALSEFTGLPFFREQGCDARGRTIEQADGPVIASIHSCQKGFNLQYKWNCNLYVSPFAASKWWQQSLGRTHREGQKRDVSVEILMMVRESYTSLMYALGRAQHVEETMGEPQKLLYAGRDLGQIELAIRSGDRMWIEENII